MLCYINRVFYSVTQSTRAPMREIIFYQFNGALEELRKEWRECNEERVNMKLGKRSQDSRGGGGGAVQHSRELVLRERCYEIEKQALQNLLKHDLISGNCRITRLLKGSKTRGRHPDACFVSISQQGNKTIFRLNAPFPVVCKNNAIVDRPASIERLHNAAQFMYGKSHEVTQLCSDILNTNAMIKNVKNVNMRVMDMCATSRTDEYNRVPWKNRSMAVENAIEFWNNYMAPLELSNGASISAAVQVSNRVMRPVVVSLSCPELDRHHVTTSSHNIRPHRLLGIDHIYILQTIAPLISRFVHGIRETYVVDVKGFARDNYHAALLGGDMQAPLVGNSVHEITLNGQLPFLVFNSSLNVSIPLTVLRTYADEAVLPTEKEMQIFVTALFTGPRPAV